MSIVAAVIAVVAAVAALGAVAYCAAAVRRLRTAERLLEQHLEQGRGEFDRIVATELAERGEELARQLARRRADALSELAEEERRIVAERRRDVAERERDANARLGDQLVAAQGAVEQRVVDWQADVTRLQQSLTDELKRLEERHRQLMSTVSARIGQDAEGQQAEIDEQRQLLTRLRAELTQATHDATRQATAELEQHAAERRHALHELAERLRDRERGLRELVERETNEATGRIQIALGDIERRQVEQVERAVSRETARLSEAASIQFEESIRTAREGAARRLGRELDLAVERFAREAESVLGERLGHVSDAATKRVEDRLSTLGSTLDRQRDEALRALAERAHQVESGLRERLHEIAVDAESDRGVIEARLQELARRLDELVSRAGA